MRRPPGASTDRSTPAVARHADRREARAARPPAPRRWCVPKRSAAGVQPGAEDDEHVVRGRPRCARGSPPPPRRRAPRGRRSSPGQAGCSAPGRQPERGVCHAASMAEAFLWGLVAASTLLAGALLAEVRTPTPRTLGLVMGFGSGVLLSAVAYELVEEAIDTAGTSRASCSASSPARPCSPSATSPSRGSGTRTARTSTARPRRPGRSRSCWGRCSTASPSRPCSGSRSSRPRA